MIRFLTFDEIQKEYSRLAMTLDELSEPLQLSINPLDSSRTTLDYASVLKNGWAWQFEYMALNQPCAYEVLKAYQPKLYVGERIWPDFIDPKRLYWEAKCFLQLGERFIHIHPEFVGRIEDRQESHVCYQRYLSLPEPIAKAYYERMDGMEVLNRLPGSPMDSRVLPAKMSGWLPPMDVCKKDKKSREAMTVFLNQVADPEVNSDPLESFRVLLDSREQDNFGPNGDHLLVQEDSLSKRIYHLPNRDFNNLRLVTDPVKLMDEYVAYVFRGGEGVFDFKSYSLSL